MNKAGWFIAGIITAAAMSAVWFAVPDSKPAAIKDSAQAARLEARDANGNRFAGRESPEPSREVFEVIDLAQVYEPRPGEETIYTGQVPSANEFANEQPRRRIPYAADVEPPYLVNLLSAASNGAENGQVRHALRFGEETTEPPAGVRSFREWFRMASLDLMSRLMPMKGSPNRFDESTLNNPAP